MLVGYINARFHCLTVVGILIVVIKDKLKLCMPIVPFCILRTVASLRNSSRVHQFMALNYVAPVSFPPHTFARVLCSYE